MSSIVTRRSYSSNSSAIRPPRTRERVCVPRRIVRREISEERFMLLDITSLRCRAVSLGRGEGSMMPRHVLTMIGVVFSFFDLLWFGIVVLKLTPERAMLA